MPNKGLEDVLTASQQRALAIGLLVLMVLLIILLIVMPLINLGLKLHDQQNDLAFRLKRYEKIIAGKETVIANIANARQENTQNYFNRQETEALASASTQELIKNIISEAGGQLLSTQAVTDDKSIHGLDKFIAIAVKATMTGNSVVLRNVLYRIENSLPLMIINQMDIKPAVTTNGESNDKLTVSDQLEVDFQVVSFMRKPVNDE